MDQRAGVAADAGVAKHALGRRHGALGRTGGAASRGDAGLGVLSCWRPMAEVLRPRLRVSLVLAALTVVNLALIWFGGTVAMWSPMMFDRGGQDDNVLWAIFWSFLALPVVALIGAILPWLFLWLHWLRVAVITAAIPALFALAIAAAVFIY
jgi:hypothetical protein